MRKKPTENYLLKHLFFIFLNKRKGYHQSCQANLICCLRRRFLSKNTETKLLKTGRMKGNQPTCLSIKILKLLFNYRHIFFLLKILVLQVLVKIYTVFLVSCLQAFENSKVLKMHHEKLIMLAESNECRLQSL